LSSHADNRLPKYIYIYIYVDSKRTEEKGKTETNLDAGYSSDNRRMRIGGRRLGRLNGMESSNKFLKWAQEDVQAIIPSDNKYIYKLLRISISAEWNLW
jgi:hypothetical protein